MHAIHTSLHASPSSPHPPPPPHHTCPPSPLIHCWHVHVACVLSACMGKVVVFSSVLSLLLLIAWHAPACCVGGGRWFVGLLPFPLVITCLVLPHPTPSLN